MERVELMGIVWGEKPMDRALFWCQGESEWVQRERDQVLAL